jgi:hypothetical protein
VGVNILPLRTYLVNAGGSDGGRHGCRDGFEPRKTVVKLYAFTV